MTLQVPRHDEFQFPGLGLLKGLLVTAHHFVRSYGKKRNWHRRDEAFFPGDRFGIFTVEYPEQSPPLPDHYRGFPILLYDDESGAELCTACGSCVRACPVGIIHLEETRNEEGKRIPYASRYSIEYDVCINCGLCADSCLFGALVMDHKLEMAQTQRSRLLMGKEQLLHPLSYYQKLSPAGWAEIEQNAKKSLPRTIERRPEGVGIVSK
ncbi:MAG: 4Fe-4S dicluster domain-containing protein [Chloroflexia bacterium]|nr:4Fe-4S dicluster domain-containing protein [Chloroflexia bacterium]